jgi:hypothetical protein
VPAVGDARALLFEKGINSNLAGITTSPDDFFSEDAVIFTSINRVSNVNYLVRWRQLPCPVMSREKMFSMPGMEALEMKLNTHGKKD